ncbi:unnamed protein product [Psylliodes chrysocephalus]|uniref:Uncharacterized protein n=1 Tax=Psylliodes chrysocephalus TaxID=3402493 RepID=A0A9P0D3P5_9CUCU|nr:unnamed protein product [Psylliodes chrysocephala]
MLKKGMISLTILLILLGGEAFAKSKVHDVFEEIPNELKFMLKALHDICRDQCGITEASIDEIRVGQLKNDKKIKKYMSCIWLQSTMMDELGNLNIDLLHDLCPASLKDKVPKIHIDCHKKQPAKSPLEDLIFGMEDCVYKTNPEAYIMI